MTVAVALLTLNEVEGLRSLYDRIPFHAVDEVLAVDGGLTDGTREFLTSICREDGEHAGAHPRSGLGAALRAGSERPR